MRLLTMLFPGILSLCLLLAGPASAIPTTLTFTGKAHGEVIDTDFAGVTISAVNLGGGPNLAVVFNTSLAGTADPDLEDPWAGGNLAPNTVLDQILIIQENSTGCADDVCDSPDDEAGRPAGHIRFDFSTNIDDFGFDLIDIEGVTPGPESGSVTFRSGGVNVVTVPFMNFVVNGKPFYDPTVSFGNHTANRISPISAVALNLAFPGIVVSSFNSVIISLGGSGGLDNITFIPEPGTAVLLGFGFVALAGVARRRYAPRA